MKEVFSSISQTRTCFLGRLGIYVYQHNRHDEDTVIGMGEMFCGIRDSVFAKQKTGILCCETLPKRFGDDSLRSLLVCSSS